MTQRRHVEALELSTRNVNDFIAVLAHELRNPLAPIRNAVSVQKLTKTTDATFISTREIIDRQSSQLSRIVDDLLDIARITKGTLKIAPDTVAVADVVERAIESARPAIDAAAHKLNVELPAAPLFVHGDTLRLTQALTNLLNNATRYTDPGGEITVTVSASREQASDSVRISVRDTGRGIEPSMLEPIFGMFVQGKDPLNRPSAGLGVGLALARSLVELHHGSLAVHSEGLGKGSTFTIQLPLAKEASAVKAVPDVARKRPEPEARSVPSCRVLVVDDNEDAAQALSALLERHGHVVVSVNEGLKALSAFEGFRPDIVLLDLGMPGMNGLEVARRLRASHRRPSPLIVAVTGWGKNEDREQSREAGFDLHLVKPVEEPELLDILGRHSRLLH
jgi:CheY-like chemotaxis protein/two-component sensor histidine kinase